VRDRLPGAVLFACNMNQVRSPMAAGVMRYLFGHTMVVESAGVQAGGEVNGFALAAMAEIGIDISGHHPQTFRDLDATRFDLIVSLTPQAHHTALELTGLSDFETEFWPTQDPTLATGNRDQVLAAFCQVREGLWTAIQSRFGTPAAPEV
jgi:protein-tyrosine-phosphatase